MNEGEKQAKGKQSSHIFMTFTDMANISKTRKQSKNQTHSESINISGVFLL